ncbi:Cation transport regulator ChaB [Deinococcus hopiensis KR-140]|uniref:Cation transport regulator ChaB n=2 Tax=Deinococcus TaxID=1298 RepID=A0A1W1VWA3_9DEIO|nr:ChaB family protein [Deinococcus hopiensis]SMB97608.1 Cation transport regulator ChaB [Deinococcus hopiensis KR-140]
MPYQNVEELPQSQVDQYTAHQQETFLKAFNHAFEEYGGDEHRAFAVAHTAAKRTGEKEARGGQACAHRPGPCGVEVVEVGVERLPGVLVIDDGAQLRLTDFVFR